MINNIMFSGSTGRYRIMYYLKNKNKIKIKIKNAP